MSVTLSPELIELYAGLSASLDGGRYAHLAKNDAVREGAKPMVMAARIERARVSATDRQALKRKRDAITAKWRDYSDAELSLISGIHATWKNAPKRAVIRNIARVILDNRSSHRDNSTCTCVDCYTLPRNWRGMVRAYSAARNATKIMGEFGLSRNDMRADNGSRFFNYAAKYWHKYAGGKHVSLHGVDVSDVFQDAMLAAIESGDTVGHRVPAYGPAYLHTRQAVEGAVYDYRTGGHVKSDYRAWTWADWQEWAESPTKTLEEYAGYAVAREIHLAEVELANARRAARDAKAGELAASKQLLAKLLTHGETIERITAITGRSVAALLKNVDSDDAPTHVETLDTTLVAVDITASVVWGHATPEPVAHDRSTTMGGIARLTRQADARRRAIPADEVTLIVR